MDKIFRSYYPILKPKLPELPSFYWKRNCYATFMDDPIGVKLMDDIGADNVMWAIDDPHPESIYGYAASVAKSVYDAVGQEKAEKVLGGTAAKLYGF